MAVDMVIHFALSR